METERRPRGGDGQWRQKGDRAHVGTERLVPMLEGALAQLRAQARERPYLTLTASFGAGLILGGGLPLRAVIALLGVGARSAAASAFEGALRRSFDAPRDTRPKEDATWSAR